MTEREMNIRQAIECIGMMYRSLVSLEKDILPTNPHLFAIMAEGPIDEIRHLLDQIDTHLAAYSVASSTEEGVEEKKELSVG